MEQDVPHPAAPAPAFSGEPPLDDIPVDAYEDADMFDDGIPEPAFVSPAPRPSAPARAEEPRAPAPFAKPSPAFQPPEKGASRAFTPPVSRKPSVSDTRLTEHGKPAQTQPAEQSRKPDEWKAFPVDASLAWDAFLVSCEGNSEIPIPVLRQCTGEVRGDFLVLQPLSQVIGQQLQRPEKLRVLESLAAAWAGRPLQAVFRAPQKIVRTEAELKEEFSNHPVIKRFQSAYDAMLMRCIPLSR